MAVDRQPGGDPVSGAPRWYLRLRGDEKEFVTVWLTLRQRTLHHETQFMPGPETNVEATWEYLLKKNADLLGMSFALGPRGRRLPGRAGPGGAGRRRGAGPDHGGVAGLHRRLFPDRHVHRLRRDGTVADRLERAAPA